MHDLCNVGIINMLTVNYSTFRRQLASFLDRVNDDHMPIQIERQNGTPAVLISLDEYRALDETAYLLSSPANAARLKQSLEEAAAGQQTEHQLDDA